MLKAGDLARREDLRVKGVKIGKSLRDRGISHVCIYLYLLESPYGEEGFWPRVSSYIDCQETCRGSSQ